MRILFAVALPGRQDVFTLDLPEGATVAAAMAAADLTARYPGQALDELQAGVWSRPVARDGVLREGDRVELYRPLVADAKASRRERARGMAPRKR